MGLGAKSVTYMTYITSSNLPFRYLDLIPPHNIYLNLMFINQDNLAAILTILKDKYVGSKGIGETFLLQACLTSSFLPFRRSGCVTHAEIQKVLQILVILPPADLWSTMAVQGPQMAKITCFEAFF